MMGENSNIEWTDHTFKSVGRLHKDQSRVRRTAAAEGWAKRSGLVTCGRDRAAPHEPRELEQAGEMAGSGLRESGASARSGVLRLFWLTSSTTVCRTRGAPISFGSSTLPIRIPDWLLLTKRTQQRHHSVDRAWRRRALPPNVWLGITVCNQGGSGPRYP